ncbi:MAG: sugar nucleotide-binding protein [Mariprofundaceae bacterium]|nr:sugar nucleotide-binding protein [Mariprofundaceae bacterium]
MSVLILGCGYVGSIFMAEAASLGLDVMPVSRSEKRICDWRDLGYYPLLLRGTPATLDAAVLQGVTVIVDAIPLDKNNGMRATQKDWLPDLLRKCPNLQQAIYLSSTSVYGNADGQCVHESWPCQPSGIRGQQRLKAERAWHDAMKVIGQKASIFRLAGIYGHQRNIYTRLKQGGYHAIRWQPDHISNRIHVVDIVQALCMAITSTVTGVFNISDDTPTSHVHYVLALAKHLNAPAPIIVSPEEGKQYLSPAMFSFFQDSKRVDNTRMHRELLPLLRYPSFMDALKEDLA